MLRHGSKRLITVLSMRVSSGCICEILYNLLYNIYIEREQVMIKSPRKKIFSTCHNPAKFNAGTSQVARCAIYKQLKYIVTCRIIRVTRETDIVLIRCEVSLYMSMFYLPSCLFSMSATLS